MKLVSAQEAIAVIATGATVAVGGSGSLLQVPDNLLAALAERNQRTGSPSGLTVVHTMGLGDNADKGLDRLAEPGLLRRVVGSHYGHNPRLSRLIGEGKIEAFAVPAGALTLLYREIAASRPGLITSVGLRTYVDPREEGGRMNASTYGCAADLIEIDSREWLLYRSFPIDVALLRATAADEDGNLVMDDEAGFADNLALAQAAHNCGGTVIAEVKYVVQRKSLSPRDVKVPGILVDYVVQESDQWQTPVERYNPFRAGRFRAPKQALPPLELDARKLIARRAAHELQPGAVVNLGYGVATGVASILDEEGLAEAVSLTIEQGIIGGVPGSGLNGGTAINADAFVDEGAQFDFYSGGGLDICFVSFGQLDAFGNVNVSKLGGRAVGPGGFIDITQNAKKVVFCGSLTGGGLEVAVSDGQLQIVVEGRYKKFLPRVDQITFSGTLALEKNQEVVIVTDRAVFRLEAEGLSLREVAPGVDIDKHVLAQVDVPIHVPGTVGTSPRYIYEALPMSRSGFHLGAHCSATNTHTQKPAVLDLQRNA